MQADRQLPIPPLVGHHQLRRDVWWEAILSPEYPAGNNNEVWVYHGSGFCRVPLSQTRTHHLCAYGHDLVLVRFITL